MLRTHKRRDRRRMAQALSLAHLHHGLTGQNPSVGCVITNSEGVVIGEGITGLGGHPHAEANALSACRETTDGATAYVTLEPCRQRSSPENTACSDLLIEAGIIRVVCAVTDPHPVANGGLCKLSINNILTHVGTKSTEANRLYRSFFNQIG